MPKRFQHKEKEIRPMNNNNNSKNGYVEPNAKEAMKQFKMETARDFAVFPPQKPRQNHQYL